MTEYLGWTIRSNRHTTMGVVRAELVHGHTLGFTIRPSAADSYAASEKATA